MLLISKNQLVPTNGNLAMVFICKLFHSSSQVGHLKSYGVATGLFLVKTIAVFVSVSRVKHLAENLLR